MAGDVVILLSDESDSDSAFVTPHPRTASPAADRTPGFARSQEGRLPPPRLNLPTLAPAIARRHVDVIEIDDTPAPSRPSHLPSAAPPAVRSGFLSFPSDDFFTSPVTGAFPTPRPQVLNQTPSQPPMSAHRSPLQESIREKAARAAVERLWAIQGLQADNVGSNSYRNQDDHDNDDDSGWDRPAKRIRLSPSIGLHSSAEWNAKSPSPFVETTKSPPHQSYPVQPFSSPVAPNAQRLSRFANDDFDDDFDDFPPIRLTHTRQPSPPKVDAECIDLLSSSDSELDQSRSTTGPLAIDSDFVDIDDLIANPSPRPQTQYRPQPQQQQQHQSTGQRPVGHQREPPDEIMLLSSSSVVSPVARPRNRPATKGPAPTQPQRRQRPLQRSFSDGQARVFSDEEDDEYDEATADTLLVEWRESRKATESSSLAKPSVRAPPRLATKPPARRRSSFDEAAAADRQKKKKLDSEEKRKEKEAERERRQTEKDIDKERRKIAADIAKEKKAKEKAEAAAFNDANKSRLDKAVAAPEMIVRLPTTLPQATKDIAQIMLVEVKASHEEWTSSPVDNVVTWRRKISNDYKPDLGHWVPVPMRIEYEKHALVVLRGEDFVQLLLASEGDPDIRHQAGGHDLDSHVAAMTSAFPDHTIVYLIEGLNAWKSKNRTIRNRQFVAAVRGGIDPPPPTAAAQQPARPSQRLGRRGQKQAPHHLDEALVDDALLDLQIEHSGGADSDGRVLVHETASSLDTARWIKVFTEQIAIARYRQQREELYAAAASFCMDSGQIATGDDAADMYVLMLQQVARVTEPIAMGVAARFDTVPKLLRGFADEGPLALEACLRSRNRNGALSDRTVGQALSRRLYKVFTGRDPESTDV